MAALLSGQFCRIDEPGGMIMIRKLFIYGTLAVLLLGTLALGENAKASEADETNSKMNESDYLNFSSSIWRLYRDDLNYSSYILDKFSRKNMSADEALVATMSLFQLNYQTTNIAGRINPPTEYADYHSYMIQSLSMFRSYLIGMAKYYETNDRIFAANAKEYFDKSIEYNEKAIEARML